jgi:hypothetical protein
MDVQDEKRRDLLTPQSRHWYALTGTLSGTPDVGVPRTVSCKSKLPVLDWTAAEAANLFFNCLNHIRLFRDIPALKAQVRPLCKRKYLPTFHRGQEAWDPRRDTKTLFPLHPLKNVLVSRPQTSTVRPIALACRQDLPALASP